jgi:hypothetical protein
VRPLTRGNDESDSDLLGIVTRLDGSPDLRPVLGSEFLLKHSNRPEHRRSSVAVSQYAASGRDESNRSTLLGKTA